MNRIDPLAEARAAMPKIVDDSELISLEDLCRKMGRDYKEVMEDRIMRLHLINDLMCRDLWLYQLYSNGTDRPRGIVSMPKIKRVPARFAHAGRFQRGKQ